MSNAGLIREFVRIHYVERARAESATEITVCSGTVHAQLNLRNRHPAVCSALDASKFSGAYGVALLERSGPHQSSTVVWRFAV
jgi:hypothetical protein